MLRTALFTTLLLQAAQGQEIQPRQSTNSTCASVPSWMTGDRIVGGQAASTPIPWQVSIRQGTSGGGHFCGGTILDSRTILSAAHCFGSINNRYIMAGAVNRNDNSGQIIKISQKISNTVDVYKPSTLNNDYIILKLESDLQFNENVQPACLPEATYEPGTSGKTCYVSGWGTLQSGANSLPADLQWVGVPTMTNDQCKNYYNSITDSMICAGFEQGGKDSCQGDSGGPFICNENGQAILTGVVSWGAGCASPQAPGVYSRVTTVLDWIKSNMESGNPSPPGPTPTPSPPATGCGSPQWATDDWCDDENNNADCNWDGGACCNNTMQGWDDFCADCACLDPTGTDGPVCEDKWKTKKCQRKKNKGKCNKKKVKKNCAKTCEICTAAAARFF